MRTLWLTNKSLWSMMKARSGHDHLGSVIEFRLKGYFVYGVVAGLDSMVGDTLVMFLPKFPDPIQGLDELSQTPIRCKFLFFSKVASAKQNSDLMRICGKLSNPGAYNFDERFRLSLAGISEGRKWQIIERKQRRVVDRLSEEMALLSDAEIPNVAYLQHYYDSDLFPWSAELTSRGATEFDPAEFERRMRKQS